MPLTNLEFGDSVWLGMIFYPDLVKEFYANARKWENSDSKDTLNFGNVEVSSKVNGQEILVDESLLYELFGLSCRGYIVKQGKGVTNFFNEEGNKVAVELKP